MKREQEGSKKVTEITLKKKLKVEIWYVLSVVAHGTSVKKKKKKKKNEQIWLAVALAFIPVSCSRVAFGVAGKTSKTEMQP